MREDLRGFDFAGRDLSGADFTACDLRGADFHGCNLSFAHFDCCDLREASLMGIQAAGANFHGSDLRQADLRNAFTGIGSSFLTADLRGARMEGAHFRKTDFHGAWMDVADLKGARFEEVVAPSWEPMDARFDSDAISAGLVEKLQRKKPHPKNRNSPIVQAYEQGSGPALWDRLEAAHDAEAGPAKETKKSLDELKVGGNQPERPKARDRGPER